MISNAILFLENLDSELIRLNINLGEYEIDHLCFRVETQNEYDYYKLELATQGTLLTEASVNGRAISTFKLNQPINFKNSKINLIELPSPKNGSYYKTGFEHIELVTKENFDCIQKKFSDLKFKISGDKNLNPELVLNTNNGNLKFHYLPLDRVIEIEEAKITDIVFDLNGTLTDSKNVIFEGVWDLLNELTRHSFNLHLWSAWSTNEALEIIKKQKIEHFFKTMSFSNAYSRKPNPLNLNFDYKKMTTNSILMLGDTTTDVIAAKNIMAISSGAFFENCSNQNLLLSSGMDLSFYSVNEFKKFILKYTDRI